MTYWSLGPGKSFSPFHLADGAPISAEFEEECNSTHGACSSGTWAQTWPPK